MVAKSLFTSESVSEGHPDKMADQISDGILDAVLAQDLSSRVACETLIKTGMVVVAGEITTKAHINVEDVVREVVREIGYNDSKSGFDSNTCAVLNAIGNQSPDIKIGVDESDDHVPGDAAVAHAAQNKDFQRSHQCFREGPAMDHSNGLARMTPHTITYKAVVSACEKGQ